jgi:hypothetical protein
VYHVPMIACHAMAIPQAAAGGATKRGEHVDIDISRRRPGALLRQHVERLPQRSPRPISRIHLQVAVLPGVGIPMSVTSETMHVGVGVEAIEALDPMFGLTTLGHVAENATPNGSLPNTGPELSSVSWVNPIASSQLTTLDETLSTQTLSFDSTAWLPDLFLSATAHDQQEDGYLIFPSDSEEQAQPQPLQQHTFDWGFTDLDYNVFQPIGTHAFGSPATGLVLGDDLVPIVPEKNADIVKAVSAEEVDGQPNVQDMPHGEPEENSWVSGTGPRPPSSITVLVLGSPSANTIYSPTCTSQTLQTDQSRSP